MSGDRLHLAGWQRAGDGINCEAKLLPLGYAFGDPNCLAVEFRTNWHNRQSRTASCGTP